MNRLKQIRERKSFSLAQLAARTGIALRVLTEYEENTQEIALPHIKVLSKVLWVKPEELIPPPDAQPSAPPAPALGTAAPLQGALTVASPAPVGVTPAGATPAYSTPRPYAPAPPYGAPRPEDRPPRPPLPPGAEAGRGARPAGRTRREPAVMPATDGQMTEIMRLAARLNLSTEDIETEFGRAIDSITRFDAREWIKKLREDALAKAPPAKVHFGQWPGLKDDREAVYLAEQRELGSELRVVLFNGAVFAGRITDFTPYTLTLETGDSDAHEQIVLRKLAVAYYQRSAVGDGSHPAPAPDAEAKDIAPFAGPTLPTFAAPGAAEASIPDDTNPVATPAETPVAEATTDVPVAVTADASTEQTEVAAKPAAKPRASRAKAKAAADPVEAEAGGVSGGEGAPSAGAGGEEADV